MTKTQLVEAILKIEKVDTKSNLMKKTLAELKEIYEGLNTKPEDQQDEEKVVESSTPEIDMSSLMEQLKEELRSELEEKVRKELEAEYLQTNKPEDKSENKSLSSRVKKIEIDRFEEIPIMNITTGSLIYVSKKTGAEFNWTDYGDIEYMEFGELLTMRTASRRFFDEPFILVMHDDAVDHLGLTKMYNSMKSPDRIDEIFNLSQADFQEVVEKSPKGIKYLIITRARKLYDMGEFDSARKIKFLNERYQAEIGQRG